MSQSHEVPTLAMLDGHRIPIIGFGTWQIEGEEAYRSVRTALDVGYRHIDTATVYGNEGEVGRAIADSGIAREELFVTTKLPPDQHNGAREIIDSSLRLLRSDYVDLWLIHWLPRRDSAVDLWRSMLAVHEGGKARSVGVSNFGIADIDEIATATGVLPVVDQVRWSPFLHDSAFFGQLRERSIVLEGYSPLQASPLYHPLLAEIADRHHVTPAQVVLRWHIQKDIVVIPKSVHPERIAENFEIFGFSLTDDELALLAGLGSSFSR